MKAMWRSSGKRTAGWGRTLAWLTAAALLVRVGFWLQGWLSPYGAVVVFYSGEAFQKPRWTSCMHRLEVMRPARPAPFVPCEHLSMRIKARLNVPKTDSYAFASLSHDGIRIRLDGQMRIDNWQEQDFYSSGREVVLPLSAGFHDLEVEYFEVRGMARFRIEWCGGPIPPRTIVKEPYLCKPLWKDRW